MKNILITIFSGLAGLLLSFQAHATSGLSTPIGGSSTAVAPSVKSEVKSTFTTLQQVSLKYNMVPYVFLMMAFNDWRYMNNNPMKYGGYMAICPETTSTYTITTLGNPESVVQATADSIGKCSCNSNTSQNCSGKYYIDGSNSGEAKFQDAAGNNLNAGDAFRYAGPYVKQFLNGNTVGQVLTIAVCGVMIPDTVIKAAEPDSTKWPKTVTSKTAAGADITYYPIQYQDWNGFIYIYMYDAWPFGRQAKTEYAKTWWNPIPGFNPTVSGQSVPGGNFNKYVVFDASAFSRPRIDDVCYK